MATAQPALFLIPVCPEAAACKVRLNEELQSVSPEVRGEKRLLQSWTSGSFISRTLVQPVLGCWCSFETCLEPSGEGASSQNSPVSLPLRPQFFYHSHSSLPSQRVWPSQSSLHAKSCSKCIALFSRCSMHAISSSAMSQAWLCMESWTQVPEVTRALGVHMAQPRYNICLWNHLHLQQVLDNGNELSPQENRLNLKQAGAEVRRDEKLKFLNV